MIASTCCPFTTSIATNKECTLSGHRFTRADCSVTVSNSNKLLTGRALSRLNCGVTYRTFGRKTICITKTEWLKPKFLRVKKLPSKNKKLPLFCSYKNNCRKNFFPVWPLTPKLTVWSVSSIKDDHTKNCIHCQKLPYIKDLNCDITISSRC